MKGLQFLSGKLNEQQRIRFTHDKFFELFRKLGDRPCQFDHRPVHQFHRVRVERDQMLGRIHCLIKAGEMTDTKYFVGWNRLKFKVNRSGKGQGSLRTDQKPGGIQHPMIRRNQFIDVVSADATLYFRKPLADFIGFPDTNLKKLLQQKIPGGPVLPIQGFGIHFPKLNLFTILEQGFDSEDIVHHFSITDRPCTTTVVAGHSPEGCTTAGRHIDREK